MRNQKTVVLSWVMSVASMSCASFALAGNFSDKCADLTGCAKSASELTGQKYVFDSDLKGKVAATPNLELTAENAELLFTSALHMSGFTRVPLDKNTFQIYRERDARDLPIPLIHADKDHAPQIPNNWDLMTLRYQLTHPEVAEYIARQCRSFMPGNARIIPSELGGALLVTDNAPNLKKLYEIIKREDLKPTAEFKKHWAEFEKLRREEIRARTKAIPAAAAQQPPREHEEAKPAPKS